MDLLRNTVGSLADWLRQLSFGDDPRPVEPHRESKSSSTENTYAEDLVELEAIRAELDRMARENAEWLTRNHLTARTVTIKVRYADFKTVTRSHTLSVATDDADVIASWAVELMARTEAGRRPVRLLGVRVQGLIEQARGLARQARSAAASRLPPGVHRHADGVPARSAACSRTVLAREPCRRNRRFAMITGMRSWMSRIERVRIRRDQRASCRVLHSAAETRARARPSGKSSRAACGRRAPAIRRSRSRARGSASLGPEFRARTVSARRLTNLPRSPQRASDALPSLTMRTSVAGAML